ncbi:unnamed protein product [Linum tenue]|uniref:Uncharacterized protein n=1 Tax=Linum tenue TaxID=586396 RepID=A0AAV0HAU3_9ROSI|nr:unnamed protein product [Linum tenue]
MLHLPSTAPSSQVQIALFLVLMVDLCIVSVGCLRSQGSRHLRSQSLFHLAVSIAELSNFCIGCIVTCLLRCYKIQRNKRKKVFTIWCLHMLFLLFFVMGQHKCSYYLGVVMGSYYKESWKLKDNL